MNKGTELKGIIGHVNKTMEKELEALDYMKSLFKCWKNLVEKDNLETKEIELEKYVFEENYDAIKQVLQELQTIKNSNPSDAMKVLETEIFGLSFDSYNILKNYILKAQEQEKALKIIFEKKVNVQLFIARNYKDYTDYITREPQYISEVPLTQEEFNTVKEWMK